MNADPIDLATRRRVRDHVLEIQRGLEAEEADRNRELAEALANVIKKWLEEEE
ncbi:MAG: hypothetical protein ACM3US_14640 [Sphingomonadaceae bacterium]